jgi:hypothetical protein
LSSFAGAGAALNSVPLVVAQLTKAILGDRRIERLGLYALGILRSYSCPPYSIFNV